MSKTWLYDVGNTVHYDELRQTDTELPEIIAAIIMILDKSFRKHKFNKYTIKHQDGCIYYHINGNTSITISKSVIKFYTDNMKGQYADTFPIDAFDYTIADRMARAAKLVSALNHIRKEENLNIINELYDIFGQRFINQLLRLEYE